MFLDWSLKISYCLALLSLCWVYDGVRDICCKCGISFEMKAMQLKWCIHFICMDGPITIYNVYSLWFLLVEIQFYFSIKKLLEILKNKKVSRQIDNQLQSYIAFSNFNTFTYVAFSFLFDTMHKKCKNSNNHFLGRKCEKNKKIKLFFFFPHICLSNNRIFGFFFFFKQKH
jgi:hypothetical protein